MNAIAMTVTGELVDDFEQFFAPVSTDLVDTLVAQHDATAAKIRAMAAAVTNPEVSSALQYFLRGNGGDGSRSFVRDLFDIEGALGSLLSDSWSNALNITDVYQYMPQKRRDEWHEQIRNPLGAKDRRTGEYTQPPLPSFEADTVRSTLQSLLHSRSQFFAERVDGIFRALSRSHVTNRPEGFSKRMILNHMIDGYGTVDYRTAGVIDDLRCVIAKFMGRDDPKHGSTSDIIKIVRRNNGEWQSIDGGALRVRIYNGVGTAHVEVHPDMAWRLNAVLASLYPAAIPSQFREKPAKKRKIKDFELFDDLLPNAVTQLLMSGGQDFYFEDAATGRGRDKVWVKNSFYYDGTHSGKAACARADKVLASIGGVKDGRGWLFDYDPTDVIGQIVCTGRVPDDKAYQFYPTPENLAAEAVAMADIGPGHTALEPSAGTGGIADLLPKERTVCVEVSELRCKVLKEKGHNAVHADFLTWKTAKRFDRIVMNPPFSEGRWQAHLEHAAGMVTDFGVLVAILPASASGKQVLDGFDLQWSQVYSNEFSGTSVSVVILKATRK